MRSWNTTTAQRPAVTAGKPIVACLLHPPLPAWVGAAIGLDVSTPPRAGDGELLLIFILFPINY